MKNISASPNPHKGQNMKVTLTIEVEKNQEKATVYLAYLPDRDILPPANFTAWVQTQPSWQTWEELAGRLLKEFYDEILPQQVTLQMNVAAKDGANQQIELAAQQPGHKPQLQQIQATGHNR